MYTDSIMVRVLYINAVVFFLIFEFEVEVEVEVEVEIKQLPPSAASHTNHSNTLYSSINLRASLLPLFVHLPKR